MEAIEGVIQHTIAMEIDFSTVVRLDKAVILAGNKSGDLTMRLACMELNVAADLSSNILKLPFCSGEGIFQSDRHVGMAWLIPMLSGHRYVLMRRRRQPD